MDIVWRVVVKPSFFQDDDVFILGEYTSEWRARLAAWWHVTFVHACAKATVESVIKMIEPMSMWAEIWEHVKATRPTWRLEPPLGPLQPDGGRLVLLRPFKAPGGPLRSTLFYLEADGSFVDVASEEAMSGRVVLADGRVIEGFIS